MYERANEVITQQGLSLGARLLLGSVAFLFGAMMILIAPPTEKAVVFHLFGAFCLLISLTCFTRGRIRQFVGSVVGVTIFIAGVGYLFEQIQAGKVISSGRSQPSIVNAALYLAFIGLPGLAYAIKVRFGFRKPPEQHTQQLALGGQNMIPQSCLRIETKKFPVLDGEKEEITNENMYGKALCMYLEAQLPLVGISVPFYCNEDWGWWLETDRNGFKMALCIYSDPDANPNPERYAILPSIRDAKKWSWSKLKSIDNSQDVLATIGEVERLFKSDSEILVVTRHDDFPFWDETAQ